MSNPVSPDHYQFNGAQVIDLTEHLSFCAGNVVKYVSRAGRKHEDKHLEDLKKAQWYLTREILRVQAIMGRVSSDELKKSIDVARSPAYLG